MPIKPYLKILSGAVMCVALSYSLTALADQRPDGPPIPKEKMEAIRACAAAKGVELPAPPPGEKGPPPQGERPAGPPPDGGKGGPKPPHLTGAQKAIVDACFQANGVEPPKGPPGPPHGEGPKAPH